MTTDDYDSIFNLVKTSFLTAEVSNGKEQNYVSEIRNKDSYIKELELILEDNDKLIGHIILTKKQITTENNNIKGLLLGPICIKLEYRKKGFGSLLIQESLKKAKLLGFNSVFLVGNPDFYKHFDFQKTSNYNIFNVNNIPNEVVLCLELVPNTLNNIKGTIDFEE